MPLILNISFLSIDDRNLFVGRNPRNDLMKMKHSKRWPMKKWWNYRGAVLMLGKRGILSAMCPEKVK